MIKRYLSSSLLVALVLSLATPTLSFAQAAAPAPTEPPVSTTTAPSAPPAPSAPAATPPAAPDTTTPADHPSTYTIEQGDSLWTIAHKYGTTVVKLRKLNGLKKGALLHPGQVLKLPPATTDSAK